MEPDELTALHEFARADEPARSDEQHEEAVNYSTGDDDIIVCRCPYEDTLDKCHTDEILCRPGNSCFALTILADINISQDSKLTTVDSSIPQPLPHLREISSLASWTVSSYKPGCGVAALRHASPASYWQSDGPQPHILNIHFFKLVAIAHIRVYLNFGLDESYTPSRMVFLAGTGHHDLQVVRDMELRQPKGWLDVDLHSAGGPLAADEGIADLYEDSDEPVNETHDWSQQKIGMGPTLRCFLLQLRILENHHNGKDTHLRGLQIFARDSARNKKKRTSVLEVVEAQTTNTSARFPGLKEPDFLRSTIR